MAGRSSYHHGDLHDALLAAGESVLQERGLQGFTLRECARRAGVSHAAPKHHFGDATGFLTAIAARGFERLVTLLRSNLAALEPAAELVDEFHAVTCGYLEFAHSWPEHFRIMFRCDLLRVDSNELLGQANNTFLELTNVVLRQRGEPELTQDTWNQAPNNLPLIHDIVIAWSHVHGFAHLRLEQQLQMIDPQVEADLSRRVSERLSQLLQQRASYA